MTFLNVNWFSIVIAAVAAWLFGGVYYSALSRQSLAAQGKTIEQFHAEHAAQSTLAKVAPFIVVFVAEIVIAWALYGLLVHMNAFTLRAGLIAAALAWFGFVMTTMASNNAFAMRRPLLTVIDGGAWLGAFLIIGAIVGWFGW